LETEKEIEDLRLEIGDSEQKKGQINVSKLRADSVWGKLTAEQRETLEGWLFEENIGYKEALERAKQEFGLASSLTSLAVFYQHLAEERMQRELLGVKSLAGKIDKVETNWEDLGGTAMTLVAKRMLQLAVVSPGKIRELASLGRLLVANEAIEIKRRWVELEEEKRDEDMRMQCAQLESGAELQASLRQMAANHIEAERAESAEAAPEELST
jgi:hypothetical protein